MDKTILFIVRHGETEWNRAGLQQGHLDSPLTDNGIAQAKVMASTLKNKKIQRIFSSDLGRALQTAEFFASGLGLSIQQDRRLRERNLGIMQGKTKEQFRQLFPDEWTRFKTDDPDYTFPKGESARDRLKRNMECLNELTLTYKGETLLVVAHGGVLNSLYCYSQGIPLDKPRSFSLYNGAINCFSRTGDFWMLEFWGERSHLKGIKSIDDN